MIAEANIDYVSLVLDVKSMADLITSVGGDDVNDVFRFFANKVHPDKTGDSRATEAMSKLTQLREEFINGVKLEDQNGDYFLSNLWIKRQVSSLTKESLLNYERLKKSNNNPVFHKYIPDTVHNQLEYQFSVFSKRAIPISSISSLDQVHVNWILSRLLEFCMYINNLGKGYVHCGISPESVLIVPENHGIVVHSFYNTTRIDSPVKGIDSKYKGWYPAQLFRFKTANSMIDLDLAKKTAIWLLGDKSGVGNTLKRTHNPDFMEFVTKQHKDPHKCYDEYREMLKKNFETKFHELNI